ncbi:MAG: hypothetical protein M5U13_14990 [Thermoanaerobaculia bacterium]|nr:hypothetical protein [Thermoanaerobaculia bacterium]
MTCALVTTSPEGSTISPDPSDCARRARPPKKRPKNGSASRTIASAEMFTTDGETRSTTETTAVRRSPSLAAAGSGAGASRRRRVTNEQDFDIARSPGVRAAGGSGGACRA